MDAKPQRITKARLAPGPAPASSHDENIDIPRALGPDRIKPTTKSKDIMPVTGALNVAPKRAAFNDMSNFSKTTVEVGVKDLTKARPTNQAPREHKMEKDNKKENYTIPRKAGNAGIVPKRPSNPQGAAPLLTSGASKTAGNRQGASKKTTIVYHDAISAQVAPIEEALLSEKPVRNPRHFKSQPHLKAQQPVLRRTQSKHLGGNTKEAIDIEDELHEAVYEDAVEQLSDRLDGHGYEALPGDKYVAEEEAKMPVPIAQEPEEYWDDEDEQDVDLYDEQGYTTAHSYRSHGDNTTGGATTLIAPKVTANVKKELDIAKAYVLDQLTEEEIEEEAWDVSMVAEYGDEIFEYMRELEIRMQPNPHYMDIQTEIQWSMRSVLMDWLVQVHHRFSLLPETLFLTVNYIDRFLSVKVVSLGKLQLVGATAIFVAAKYEEINCPSVQEIVYMVDQGYSVEEVLKAERFMLSMLNFELGWPGPMSFLRRISKADDYDLETRTLAKYFLEVTVMDERFVSSSPSYLAAGAHCLARMILHKGDWTPAHVHYSGYTLAQLRPLITTVLQCCRDPFKHHHAVYDKYAGPKYKEASTYVERELKAGFSLDFTSTPLVASSPLYDTHHGFEYGNSGSLISAQS